MNSTSKSTSTGRTLALACAAMLVGCATNDELTRERKGALESYVATSMTCSSVDPTHVGDGPADDYDPTLWSDSGVSGDPFTFTFFDHSTTPSGDDAGAEPPAEDAAVVTDTAPPETAQPDSGFGDTDFMFYMRAGEGGVEAAVSMADLVTAVMQLYLDGKITREQVEAVTGKTYDKKNRKWVALPKDKWDERLKAFQQSDIADILATAIVAKGGKNFVWGDVPGLGKPTASFVLAAIIMEAAAVGQSIGEWIAAKLEDIAKSKMCGACTEDLLNQVALGGAKSGIWTTTYGADYKALCVYDACSSALFVVYFERVDNRYNPFSNKRYVPKAGKCTDFKAAG